MNEPLIIRRDAFSKDWTTGSILFRGNVLGVTLEDTLREPLPWQTPRPVHEWKLDDKTAIPRGIYRIRNSMSNRFKRILPEILGVEGFTGIRMHLGTIPEHTSGCILIGSSLRGLGRIVPSQKILDAIMGIIAQDSEQRIQII